LKTKKFWLLFVLFIAPLIFYVLLLTGTNNFAKLSVITKNVNDISAFKTEDLKSVTLNDKITILCFFGNDLETVKNNALNLNEKIYKHFYKFKDFQFIVILPEGTQDQAASLKKQLGAITDMQKWKFVFGKPNDITQLFNSLNSSYSIDDNSYFKHVFIIDKDRNLRGRTDDEDNGLMYGYNAETVAPIHDKMVDDVKVLVAEYRLSLKKNYKKDETLTEEFIKSK